jgi:hypothetical protein
MKRAEMLEKMKACYITCKKFKYSREQIMDRVLDICEEEGMLPPAFDIFEGRKGTFNEKMFVNKWEPEDEA